MSSNMLKSLKLAKELEDRAKEEKRKAEEKKASEKKT